MDVKLQRTDVVTKFHPQEHSAQRTQQSSWTNQEKVEKTFDAQTIDAEKLEKQVGKLNQLLDAIDMNTITFRVHEESEPALRSIGQHENAGGDQNLPSGVYAGACG